MILRHLLLPEIIEMVETGQLNDLRDFLATQPAPEIAELLVALDDKHRVLLFRVLPRHLADEVFSLLEPPSQNELIQDMAQEEVRQVLAGLTPDDRTALFEELPARVTKSLLGLLDEKDRKQALTLLSYPDNSVGRLMTDRLVRVRPEWSVAQALDHLRRYGTDSETMAMIYITDDKGRLTDDLRLRKLLLSSPTTRVSELLDGHFASLQSLQDREEAVQEFQKYDLYALPVVDADGILLGIVTVDDILDVAEEEATEDFHKLATVRPLQVSLKEATLGLLYRKRIGWLLGLVVVNVFSGAGIKLFEDTIAAVVALVFFLPLLIGSSGNAGAQASTLIVRAMATGEIETSDWWKLFLREIGVSACIGLTMSVAVFFLGWALGSLAVGLVVSLSMFTVVIAGSLLGTVLPMVLDKLKLDPATASAPLITSMADILGVLIYFSIAKSILQA
jgi:magnesium transporter